MSTVEIRLLTDAMNEGKTGTSRKSGRREEREVASCDVQTG